MRKTKVYLDTSVISFFHADDAPDFRAITRDFFADYALTGVYDVFFSDVVIAEIMRTVNVVRRNELRAIIEEYPMQELITNDEVNRLAREYVESGVIPSTHPDDARHVAIATHYEMDVLL